MNDHGIAILCCWGIPMLGIYDRQYKKGMINGTNHCAGNDLKFFARPITPQATLAPEFPVFRDSG